jgi:hypothetical protein
MASTTRDTVEATWDGGQYVTPQGWASDDGNDWVDGAGLPVDTPQFRAVAIRLCGGPRDGVVVG